MPGRSLRGLGQWGIFLWILFIGLPGLLVGCGQGGGGQEGMPGGSSPPSGGSLPPSGENRLPPTVKGYRTVTITSFDGTPIVFTVFEPALKAGETAPLVVHGHGFGGHRIRSPEDASTDSKLISDTVFRLWEAGYYVISFDQRGFGDSGGYVRVMDPDVEIRDVQAILDWAETNLRLTYRRGKPIIGTFGASYGGGFQLLTNARDARIAAMVPMVTWYNLPYSLAPGDVPKTAWATLLIAGGTAGSRGRMDPVIYDSYVRGLLSNGMEPDARAFFGYHSLAYFCERGRVNSTPALVVQGMRDTLFNLNEGYWIAKCLERTGADVRLVTVQTGHVLPYLQAPAGKANCGPMGRDDPGASILAWFEEKLRGKVGAASGIPRLCLSLDDQEAITLDRLEVPRGGVEHQIPRTLLLPLQGLSGLSDAARRLLNSVLAAVAPYLDPAGGLVSSVAGALVGPVFVPLKTFTESAVMAGIPLFHLEISSPVQETNPIIFVGVGIRRVDGRMEVVDEQVYPLKGFGIHEGELVGVGAKLNPGDTLGLVLFGFNEQFLLNGSRLPFVAEVRGSVRLPYELGSW